MEQKKTLWIVAAVGIFLLVVAGAALILYSPSLHRTPVQQASFDPSTGWVSNFQAEQLSKPNTENTNQFSSAPAATETFAQATKAPSSPFENQGNASVIASANGIVQNQPSQTEAHPESLTVYTDKATVYSQETTTIDLNALKASNSTGVTAQNKLTENQIASTKNNSQPAASENYYTPAPKATAPAKAAPKKTAVAKSSTASNAAKASAKASTAAKVATTAKASPDKYWVQPASYASKKYADEARSILESNKITSEVFTFTDTKGKTFYRVRIGPYVTKSEAEYWQSRVAMIDKFADSKSIIVNTKTN